MSEIDQLIALRAEVKALIRGTPQSHAKRRRFLGRLDRTILVMIGHLTGNILDDSAYDSLAAEFNAASGQLRKSTEQLAEITKSLGQAKAFMDTLSAILNTIARP